MESHSLEPLLIVPTSDTSRLRQALAQKRLTGDSLVNATAGVDFNTAYDFLRSTALDTARSDNPQLAVDYLLNADQVLSRLDAENGLVSDIHTALMQILTGVYISMGCRDEAMKSAARGLTLLAQQPKRRDEPFLSVLAALLYDISLIHYDRGEYKQAERDIEKSTKIFERLTRISAERYASAHVTALHAATQVTRSRQKQIDLLAHYHETVNESMRRVNEGDIDLAVSALVEQMHQEGLTLAKMGRHREATQYYSRALKYLTRIESEFSPAQLQLSIDLGEALLNVKATREKGIHLLNTMLHKSTKLHDDASHRRIVDILVNARERSLDILGIWHKFFPR